MTLDPNRPLRCQACHGSKPATQYPITRSGNRRRLCESCYGQKDHGTKQCIKCRLVLQRTIDFKRSGQSRGYVAICRACELSMPPNLYHCGKCSQDLPIEDFGRTNNGARRVHCKGCTRAAVHDRVCRRCRVRKEFSEYPRYKSNAHGRVCRQCLSAYYEKRGQEPREVPNPCKQCGKKFSVAMPKCRRDLVKFCSPECHLASKRCVSAQCNLCLKQKPRSEFNDRRMGGRRQYCKTCERKKINGDFAAIEGKLSVASILNYLRSTARYYKQPVTLSVADVAPLQKLPCKLCGLEMYCLVPKMESEPYTLENVVPCCIPCRKLVVRKGYAAVIEWAMLVAEGQGMIRPSSQPGVPRLKKLRRRRASDRVWLHPDSPLNQPINETFEQKLARFSQLAVEREEARHRTQDQNEEYARIRKAERKQLMLHDHTAAPPGEEDT